MLRACPTPIALTITDVTAGWRWSAGTHSHRKWHDAGLQATATHLGSQTIWTRPLLSFEMFSVADFNSNYYCTSVHGSDIEIIMFPT